jgi:hypothetical protein
MDFLERLTDAELLERTAREAKASTGGTNALPRSCRRRDGDRRPRRASLIRCRLAGRFSLKNFSVNHCTNL